MIRLLMIMILVPYIMASVRATDHAVYGDYGQGNDPYVIASEEKKNEYVKEIHDKAKPEIDWVSLKDEAENGLLGSARISDIYNVEVMSSGVVGLVGAPMRISYDEGLSELILTFHYVPEELRGMPERNMIILHETEDQGYIQVGEETIDMGNQTISVPIKEAGVYLVADRYQWYTVWGLDMSEYQYTIDIHDYVSDWERECDTGSIMELADKDWALENGPYFHVSTPEQLASVVYYVNAVNDLGLEEITLYLEDDIDLAGYDWVPMGWIGPSSIRFDGMVDGQGHTISNMDIHIPYKNHCAFIGYSTGVTVKNITFENAKISGGSYTGIVGGEIYISRKWENVHVSGTISDAYDEVGSIIGRESVTYFENCSADVVYLEADGSERPLEYFSHKQEVLANTPATEDFTLTVDAEGNVTRTESEKEFRNLGWHVEVDHVQVLDRLAEKETTFNPREIIPAYIPAGSHCEIWLTAYTGETYTRVSNIVEYPTE